MIIDLQVLQGGEHGVMDATPSKKTLGVQLSDGEYMGEDTSNEDPVFFLYPLVPDYALYSILGGSAVNTQLEDRALHECWIALAKGASGVAEAIVFPVLLLHENIAVGSAAV